MHVGQERPEPLGADELAPHRREVSQVPGHPGLHRADEHFLDPGLALEGAGPAGEGLGRAPVAAGDGQERSLAQRVRQDVRHADSRSAGDRFGEGGVAIVRAPGQDQRDSPAGHGHRRYDSRRREPPHGLVGVGQHLLHPAPA